MQPEIQQVPIQGSERAPIAPPVGGEQIPSLPPLEQGIEQGVERREQQSEAGAIASQIAPQYQAQTLQQASIAPPQPMTPQGASASGPATAADEDLMEKEWVDKAKQVVASTKGNPYEQTRQVDQLKRDYLKKRYNRDIGE